MKSLLLAMLFLSACSNGIHSVTFGSVAKPVPAEIPDELKFCPQKENDVVPLPTIRTTEDIGNYAKALEASREKLMTKLAICDKRREDLLNRLKETQ